MSALGQKQTSRAAISMSALPPKADIAGRQLNVRFVPKADIAQTSAKLTVRVNTVEDMMMRSALLLVMALLGGTESFGSSRSRRNAGHYSEYQARGDCVWSHGHGGGQR
jgi:hypothetical protein